MQETMALFVHFNKLLLVDRKNNGAFCDCASVKERSDMCMNDKNKSWTARQERQSRVLHAIRHEPADRTPLMFFIWTPTGRRFWIFSARFRKDGVFLTRTEGQTWKHCGISMGTGLPLQGIFPPLYWLLALPTTYTGSAGGRSK